jgi:hypothetical protein
VSVAVVLFSGDMNGWRIRRAQAKSSTAPWPRLHDRI